MSSVLTLVEVEILNALLTPIPIETVAILASELIRWAKVWFFNCKILLPPIIKLLNRLDEEGREDEYNQIALEHCDTVSFVLHFYTKSQLISIVADACFSQVASLQGIDQHHLPLLQDQQLPRTIIATGLNIAFVLQIF